MTVRTRQRGTAGLLIAMLSALLVLVAVTRASASTQVEAVPGLLIYMVDADGSVWRIGPDGTMTEFSDQGVNGTATDVALADDGKVYVTIVSPAEILQFAPDGTVADTWGAGTLNAPVSLTVDNTANAVYVADSGPAAVYKFTADGNPTPITIDGLVDPRGVAADPAGNVFVADHVTGSNTTTVYKLR